MLGCPTHFSYTHSIEAVSCDEMLVDLTEVLSDTGASPLQVAPLQPSLTAFTLALTLNVL